MYFFDIGFLYPRFTELDQYMFTSMIEKDETFIPFNPEAGAFMELDQHTFTSMIEKDETFIPFNPKAGASTT